MRHQPSVICHHSFTSKKPLPLKNRDKSINSCGTTLIGRKGPLVPHTFICAPLITDGDPVGYYSQNAFVPPSKVHSKRLPLPQSHHLRLSLKRTSESTILSHRFNLQFTLIICRRFQVVKYLYLKGSFLLSVKSYAKRVGQESLSFPTARKIADI